MNNDMTRLMLAVTDSRYMDAKKICREIAENNTTKKDEQFCRRIANKLAAQSNFLELPNGLNNLIQAEDVSASFREERYFLTEREKAVLTKVLTMVNTAKKLQDMGIRYLNSTLLYGESGTGKTLFGRYLAYKLERPFVYMNFSHTIDSYLGGTGKNLRKIFNFAKEQECVFMIDEIDAVGVKRGDSKEVGEMNRIVIGLMQELDMLGNDTLLIAATNRIDILDDALKRRFSIHHEIKRFNAEEMIQMINALLDDVGMETNQEELMQYTKAAEEKKATQGVVLNEVITRIAEAVEKDSTKVYMASRRG